jgi:hypothetical protein
MTIEELKPGLKVRVIQTVDRRAGDWQTAVVGVIQSVEEQKTGSWYAHAKDDRFWLRRIRLQKDDGEITVLNVDDRTKLELLGGGGGQSQ